MTLASCTGEVGWKFGVDPAVAGSDHAVVVSEGTLFGYPFITWYRVLGKLHAATGLMDPLEGVRRLVSRLQASATIAHMFPTSRVCVLRCSGFAGLSAFWGNCVSESTIDVGCGRSVPRCDPAS